MKRQHDGPLFLVVDEHHASEPPPDLDPASDRRARARTILQGTVIAVFSVAGLVFAWLYRV